MGTIDAFFVGLVIGFLLSFMVIAGMGRGER